MATVSYIAQSALRKILVQGSEAPLEGDDYEDFINLMNSYMAERLALGVDLGYTDVSSLSDEVTVPAGAVNALINVLAVEAAPEYGGIVSPDLAQKAREGLNTLRILGTTITPTSLSALPLSVADQPYFSEYE